VQTWPFYYDDKGELLDLYPSSVDIRDKPQALGYRADKIPKKTATLECEVTGIYYKDGTEWFNENLFISMRRPLHGFTEAELATHTGERIAVSAVDPRSGRVTLENLTDEDVKSCTVNVFWFRADGSSDHGFDNLFPCVIPAKKKITAKLKLDTFMPEKGKPFTVAERNGLRRLLRRRVLVRQQEPRERPAQVAAAREEALRAGRQRFLHEVRSRRS
jgi:hypothetical protein